MIPEEIENKRFDVVLLIEGRME